MVREQYTRATLKLYALYGVWHLRDVAKVAHLQAYKMKNELIMLRIRKLNQVHMLWRPSSNIKACLDAMRYNKERIAELSH